MPEFDADWVQRMIDLHNAETEKMHADHAKLLQSIIDEKNAVIQKVLKLKNEAEQRGYQRGLETALKAVNEAGTHLLSNTADGAAIEIWNALHALMEEPQETP